MTTATRTTMGSEHAEQVALIQWAAWLAPQAPALRLLFAVPNGGKRQRRIRRTSLRIDGLAVLGYRRQSL